MTCWVMIDAALSSVTFAASVVAWPGGRSRPARPIVLLTRCGASGECRRRRESAGAAIRRPVEPPAAERLVPIRLVGSIGRYEPAALKITRSLRALRWCVRSKAACADPGSRPRGFQDVPGSGGAASGSLAIARICEASTGGRRLTWGIWQSTSCPPSETRARLALGWPSRAVSARADAEAPRGRAVESSPWRRVARPDDGGMPGRDGVRIGC